MCGNDERPALKRNTLYVISGSRRGVDEIFALLGHYAPLSGCSLPTFRDNISVPSSRVKKSKKKNWASWPLMMGPTGCPKTSVHNYHSTLCNIPEECRYQTHCSTISLLVITNPPTPFYFAKNTLQYFMCFAMQLCLFTNHFNSETKISSFLRASLRKSW